MNHVKPRNFLDYKMHFGLIYKHIFSGQFRECEFEFEGAYPDLCSVNSLPTASKEFDLFEAYEL